MLICAIKPLDIFCGSVHEHGLGYVCVDVDLDFLGAGEEQLQVITDFPLDHCFADQGHLIAELHRDYSVVFTDLDAINLFLELNVGLRLPLLGVVGRVTSHGDIFPKYQASALRPRKQHFPFLFVLNALNLVHLELLVITVRHVGEGQQVFLVIFDVPQPEHIFEATGYQQAATYPD